MEGQSGNGGDDGCSEVMQADACQEDRGQVREDREGGREDDAEDNSQGGYASSSEEDEEDGENEGMDSKRPKVRRKVFRRRRRRRPQLPRCDAQAHDATTDTHDESQGESRRDAAREGHAARARYEDDEDGCDADSDGGGNGVDAPAQGRAGDDQVEAHGHVDTHTALVDMTIRPHHGPPVPVTFMVPDKAEGESILHDVIDKNCYLTDDVLLAPGATVVDVGASFGAFSVLCLATCPRARVLAIEPGSTVALHANLNQNEERFATGAAYAVIDSALAEKESVRVLVTDPAAPGEATLVPTERQQRLSRLKEEAERLSRFASHDLPPPKPDSTDLNDDAAQAYLKMKARFTDEEILMFAQTMLEYVSKKRATKHQQVTTRTLSSVIDEFDITTVDLLKIDCEGCEYLVLQGLRDEHWPRIKQVVAEVFGMQRLRDMEALLRRHGLTSIRTRRQDVCVYEDGFVDFTPASLDLYLLSATRQRDA